MFGGRFTLREVSGVVVGVALAVIVAWVLMPRPPKLDGPVAGDAELAGRIDEIAGGESGRLGLAAAVVSDGRVRTVGVGSTGGGTDVTPATSFEIGSVAKPLTGMMLASMAEDGVIDPSASLGDTWHDVEFEDEQLRETSLERLASHRSGLPRLADPLTTAFWSGLGWVLGNDPYASAGTGVGALIDQAIDESAEADADFAYSNLGMALLGHAQARDAGLDYMRLLDRELLAPLGMDDTLVVDGDGASLPVDRASPHTASGLDVAAWRDAGYAPAGVGVWSTVDDLGTLLQAMVRGTAPGVSAAEPRFDAGDTGRIGYGWITSDRSGKSVTWHNGATGGSRSWVGFDREGERGAVVLANTSRDVERIGLELLNVDPGSETAWWGSAPTITTLLLTGVAVVSAAGRLWELRRRSGEDRLALLVGVSGPTVLVVGAWLVGTWAIIPPVLWGLAAVATVLLVQASVWRGMDAPSFQSGRNWKQWINVAFSLLTVGAAIALLGVAVSR